MAMTLRVWAAAAAVVLGVLLLLVAVRSVGPEVRVVPTVGVAPSGVGYPAPQVARNQIESLLATRTRLQAEPSVASGTQVDTLLQRGGARLTMREGVEDGGGLVRQWIADVPKEPGLLRPSQYRAGQSSLPYREAGVLVQPEGRDFRRQHNDQIRYGGGWLIFGVGLALALFLFARGRIGIAEPWSGETVERFSTIERANHWMTSSAFIIMALTGLVVLYGKPLLLPWMGPDTFGTLARWSAWAHMAAAVPFVIGILAMAALWLRGNLPTRLDWEWLKRGGGFLRDDGNNPPAERFNAGQKMVFWVVLLGGLGMLASGLALMFPLYALGYAGMQWMQLGHAALGLAMMAVIIGHIYIGSVGMVGAFEAMWNGVVDRNWAKEHHSLWYERLTGSRNGREGESRSPPARPVSDRDAGG